MKTNGETYRNFNFIRRHPQCRLCSYAGFSNICTFSETGICPYDAGIMANTKKEEVAIQR